METIYEWRNTEEGISLVETLKYEGEDSMPKTETTIVGGVQKVDSYHVGYVVKNKITLPLISRMDADDAKKDVVMSLKGSGKKIKFNHEKATTNS
jgi:hypothetical protein